MAKKAKKSSPKKTKKNSKKELLYEHDSEQSFGGITIIKTGTSLAALLLSQTSNGMSVGPIY